MYADLVEQQTTTTGTGTYVISGSVLGRQTFANAFIDGEEVPYVVTDDAGNYECGLGTWTESTFTLARTVILTSSNANAAVSWAAGTKRVYVSPSALLIPGATRRNFVGIGNPTTADDQTKGYRKGSEWTSYAGTTGPVLKFICEDASTGAAIWRRVFVPSATTWGSNSVEQVAFGGAILDPTSNSPFGPTGLTMNGYVDGANSRYADGGIVPHGAFTSGNTPTKMAYKGDHTSYGGIYCEGPSCVTITGSVSCIDGSGNIKSWKIEAVAKTNSSGDTSIVAGSSPSTLYSGDAALSSASIAVVGGTAAYDCAIQVTGIAATNLTWSAALVVSSAADY